MSYEFSEESKDIKLLLEKILAILKMANNKQIIEAKKTISESEIKKRVYELCDGKHTVSDIAKKIDTTQPNVSYHLSSLLEQGLVLYEVVGGKRYYFKTLE